MSFKKGDVVVYVGIDRLGLLVGCHGIVEDDSNNFYPKLVTVCFGGTVKPKLLLSDSVHKINGLERILSEL